MDIEIQKKIAPIGLVIGCIVFGLGSVIVAHLPIGAYAIAFWRLAVAAVIFAMLTRWFAQKFPKNQQTIKTAWIAGVFLGLDLALWHESIYAVGPGISTVLNCLQIFWLSAIGVFWFREKLSKWQIWSLIMAMLGIVLIGSPEFSHNPNALWGFVSGILSGLMLALSMVFVRKTQQISPIPIFPLMFHISLGGMLVLIVPMILFNYDNMLPQTWSHIAWILVYGVVMQCFAWGMIAYAIPLLSLNLSGLLLLSEPVAALVIDAVFLNKEISCLQWFGACVTMLAIYFGSLKNRLT